MERMIRLQKGENLPGVGGGVKRVKKKCIGRNQRGDTASKGVGAARRTIIRSTRHRPETRRQM